MPEINVSDQRGRDAMVAAESVSISHEMRWLDEDGAQVGTRKILRATMAQDLNALQEGEGGGDLDKLAEKLVEGDPEVDLESFGSFLSETSRVYLNESKEVVHRITHWEVLKNPDGSDRERRPKKTAEPNVAAEIPLTWTGTMMKKADACRRFVFSGKVQIQHINGLTYDFLYAMAKELEEKDSLMLLAGGAKGKEPLVFRRSGLAYRGFLEGRTEGARYALLLHLSNMELKAPPPSEEDENPPKKEAKKKDAKEAKAEGAGTAKKAAKKATKKTAKKTAKKAAKKAAKSAKKKEDK